MAKAREKNLDRFEGCEGGDVEFRRGAHVLKPTRKLHNFSPRQFASALPANSTRLARKLRPNIVCSQDTRTVAAASIDRVVHVWSTQTHKLLHRLDGHTQSVYAVTFSHDGSQLVSGGLDKTIKVSPVQGTQTDKVENG